MAARGMEETGTILTVYKPFTLSELILFLKARFNLSGAVVLAVWVGGYHLPARIESDKQITQGCTVKITEVAGDLWSQPREKHWRQFMDGNNTEQLTIREGGNTQERDLWEKLLDIMGKMCPDFDASTRVTRAVAIKNDTLKTNFEGLLKATREKHVSNEIFRKQFWGKVGMFQKERTSLNETDRRQRHKFHDHLTSYAAQFDENYETTVRRPPFLFGAAPGVTRLL